MTCYLGIVSKFFQVCCFPYLTNIAPYFDNHTRNISSILILSLVYFNDVCHINLWKYLTNEREGG